MDKPDEQLLHRMKTYVPGGANNHTFSKARFYYEGTRSPKKRAELDGMIREALVNHDWSKLRIKMKGWW